MVYLIYTVPQAPALLIPLLQAGAFFDISLADTFARLSKYSKARQYPGGEQRGSCHGLRTTGHRFYSSAKTEIANINNYLATINVWLS